MKVLFATDRMHIPDDQSGSVQTNHAFATALVKAGHDCQVVATASGRVLPLVAAAVYRASAKRVILEWRDSRAGYPSHRGSEWRFARRVQRRLAAFTPDVLVLDAVRQVTALVAAGVTPRCRMVLYLHDVHFRQLPPRLPEAIPLTVVANSPFTAAMFEAHYAIPATVVPPLIEHERYRCDGPRTEVTMVSPTEPKGVDTVLELARLLPEVSILLVEGWPMGPDAWNALVARTAALPNVRLERSVSDMRAVYSRTRVLLVPSRVEESFGRVVVEAQVSGVPVLARDVGALRWVVGAGGVVVSPDADPRHWAALLRAVLSDDTHYATLSRAAADNIGRPEFRPDTISASFQRALAGLAQTSRR